MITEMPTENLVETTFQRSVKNKKRKPRMREKLYIRNSKHMMTWTNNQRMLMMGRRKGDWVRQKTVHYYEFSSNKEKGEHCDPKKLRKTKMATRIQAKMMKMVRLLSPMK